MKKVLGSLMAALLIVFMFSTTVSAAQLSSEDIVSLVNRTNISIEHEIIKAQIQADSLMTKYDIIISQLEKIQQILPIDNQAYIYNTKLIEESKLRCDQELDRIVNRLIQTTNQIASETISIAAENGYTVICELVEVEVGNRVILIDPLRVSDT